MTDARHPDRESEHGAPRYAAYLLRVWLSAGPDWRIVLENVSTGERAGFSRWSTFVRHLYRRTTRAMPMSINNLVRTEAIVVPAGAGEPFAGMGANIVLKAGGAQTAGQFLVADYTAPPGFAGPPPHWHKAMTEMFYVLEGTLEVLANDQRTELGAGGFALVPPGVVHTFANPSSAPARFLLVATPAGLERYFVELTAMAGAEAVWPPKDATALHALMARYDTFVL
jgi:uncharacterized cupin superfamily protein